MYVRIHIPQNQSNHTNHPCLSVKILIQLVVSPLGSNRTRRLKMRLCPREKETERCWKDMPTKILGKTMESIASPNFEDMNLG